MIVPAGERQIKKGTRREVGGILVLTAALLSGAALWLEPGGLYGETLVRVLYLLFGRAAIGFPAVLGLIGIALMVRTERKVRESRVIGYLFMMTALLTLLHLSMEPGTELVGGFHGLGGGVIGGVVLWLLRTVFGLTGSQIVIGAITLSGFLLITDISIIQTLHTFKKKIGQGLIRAKERLTGFLFTEKEAVEPVPRNRRPRRDAPDLFDSDPDDDAPVLFSRDAHSGIRAVSPDLKKTADPVLPTRPTTGRPAGENITGPLIVDTETAGKERKPHREYTLPPVTLLKKPYALRSGRGQTDKSRLLEDTLASFGVHAKVTNMSRGPVVTRYELHPAPGVKVSRVLNLADDLALSLATADVRIEAPIPGKAAIGIEVPNEEISLVSLREVLEVQAFQDTPSKLAVGLGKDIAGAPVVSDLGKMVHLLVAGATGSGKSVCMNTIIASILFKSKPDEVKLLMIDPKVVELNQYNGIPHLAAPVVTDPRKAAGVLKWVVQEMENRYSLFAASGVREISKYNQMLKERAGTVAEEEGEISRFLPYMIVIIDELADLMMVAAVEVEDAICRLAQMARAAGIHLVVATQRPSVDVVTGLIKANIPSRISFSVSSQVDSRTILDMGGAEKLLGRGDMLFLPSGSSKPVRIQGAFITEREIEDLVSFWKKQDTPEYEPGILKANETGVTVDDHDDELFPRAVELILNADQASISLLQRRMHIGYTRAARLIDMMEDRGIVGKHEGSKAREILISMDQWLAMCEESERRHT
jgi:DNA segregation ATPase FtsK/SpoIIIE, S-DNA-T family